MATASTLDRWEIATYLGVVTGQAMIESSRGPDAGLLGRARAEAVDRMVGAAVARGAHGVIGVAHEASPVAGGYLVTFTGTAVTLSNRR